MTVLKSHISKLAADKFAPLSWTPLKSVFSALTPERFAEAKTALVKLHIEMNERDKSAWVKSAEVAML